MKRILVCEDEDAIRDFVVINLKRAGYDVTDVNCGEEALRVFDEENGESLTAETVARQTGAALYTLTMGMGEGEMGCTDAIYRNIDTIREALG